jgi:DNA-binding response OmpR family regulator
VTALLVVEDDPRVASFLCRGLEAEGYRVVHVTEGEAALDAAGDASFAAILLDVMLAGALDGRAVCQALRRRRDTTPILMLTALDTVQDRIEGLRMGADDYLGKPFSFDELLLRHRIDEARRPERAEAVEMGAHGRHIVPDRLREIRFADEGAVEPHPVEHRRLEVRAHDVAGGEGPPGQDAPLEIHGRHWHSPSTRGRCGRDRCEPDAGPLRVCEPALLLPIARGRAGGMRRGTPTWGVPVDRDRCTHPVSDMNGA